MKLPDALGVVETNSIDYIRILFAALVKGRVVAPLRSVDDEERKAVANVKEVVQPSKENGWFDESLSLTAADDIAHISFTSGTEGMPKGVLLARRSLVDVVDRVQSLMQMNEEVSEYIGVPVYHSFGYGRCRHVASVGGKFYIPANGFDPKEVSELLLAKKINALSLVPSLLRVFIHNPVLIGEEGLQLRWLEIGSQAMSRDEKKAVRDMFPNARIVQHYGLTEASRSTLLQIDGADDAALESVGQAYGDCQLRINDEGCIQIQGPHVASGILKEGQLQPALNHEGWLTTTDLGRIENGYLFFEGRADNVINCGGQKISSDALELAITADMKELSHTFAVSKIPHLIYGEGFLISYSKEGDLAKLKKTAQAALTAGGIKAKNAMAFNAVAEIPKTHTGKTQHKLLSDEYLKNLDNKTLTASSQVQQVFVDVLGLSPDDINREDSASAIGIDSIQSVQLSLKIENYLGYLPIDWRTLTIKEIEAMPVTERESVTVKKTNDGKAEPLWDGSSNGNPKDISFWELVKEDFNTHEREYLSQGFFAIFVNRFGNWRMGVKSKLFRAPMTIIYNILRKWSQVFCGIKLDYTVKVGRRVKLEHFGGMMLGARSIGDDTIVRQNTTFGIRDLTDLSAKPTIENGVNIGAGVVIVGDVVIGRHSVIGPNCVITEDLPPFSVVSVSANIVTHPAEN